MNFPALDVAIGLIFVYFILALVSSGINEAISSFMRWRSQDLEHGLRELLRDPERGHEALVRLTRHPLIHPMLHPDHKRSHPSSQRTAGEDPEEHARKLEQAILRQGRKTAFPSYIPARTFATALLGFGHELVSDAKGVDLQQQLRKINQSIGAIPSDRVQRALVTLLHDAQGDAMAFRRNVEQWYDDHMERVSGWYRRRIQRVLWVLAIALAFLLNADTLQMAKRLWTEPGVRSALVSRAQTAGAGTQESVDTSKELERLSVPLGWHFATSRHDPQGFPVYEDTDAIWAFISKLVGLLLTAVAITFGAPFWFDTLSKLGRLRNSGAPPPVTDALRRGEGEETRRGESAALTAALLEARGKSTETEAPGTVGAG